MHTTRRDLVKNAACSAFMAVAIASIAAPAPAWGQKTEIVSLNSSGEQGNDDSLRGSVSDDGRYVAFESEATNLVDLDGDGTIDPDVNGLATDIFVYDRVTGTIEIASVNSAGAQADAGGRWPDMSADGRYVTFSSGAVNLVDSDGDGAFDDDTNGAFDIFVHDRMTGTTERVSVNSRGMQGNRGSFPSRISPGGQYVAFSSAATNLIDLDGDGIIDADSNGDLQDVFLHDRATGTTELVSLNSAGEQGNGRHLRAGEISAGGRFVAFLSPSTNLVDIDGDGAIDIDINGSSDAFVRDRLTATTELVHVNTAGEQGNGSLRATNEIGIDITPDGRFVAFAANSTNLSDVDPGGNGSDVFVHDRLTRTTEIVSVNSLGIRGNNQSIAPSLSANGRLVAFRSHATNLVDLNGDRVPDPDNNRNLDIFVHDRSTGITETVSINTAGALGTRGGFLPAISRDGQFVVFASRSDNLVDSDGDGVFDDDATPFHADFYLRDRRPTPPELVVTAPQPGAAVLEGPVRIEGTATDDGAVRRVTVNGAVAGLVATGNPDDPNEVAFTVTLILSAGPQVLRVVATDDDGNTTSLEIPVDVEPESLPCDVNRDSAVDRVDIASIFAARGQTATGPGDPRDVNGDGLITINDGRLCVLQCTNPGCDPAD